MSGAPGPFQRRSALSYAGDSLFQIDPPRTFSACMAATLGVASDSRLSDPEKIIAKLHVDSDRGTRGLRSVVDEALRQRDVRRASGNLPIHRLRAFRCRPPSMGNLRQDCSFRMTRLPCARWMCTPSSTEFRMCTPNVALRPAADDGVPPFNSCPLL